MNFIIDGIPIPYPKKKCPNCKNEKMWDGPRGGLSQNIFCPKCGKEWNYSPMGFDPIIPARPELYSRGEGNED